MVICHLAPTEISYHHLKSHVIPYTTNCVFLDHYMNAAITFIDGWEVYLSSVMPNSVDPEFWGASRGCSGAYMSQLAYLEKLCEVFFSMVIGAYSKKFEQKRSCKIRKGSHVPPG
jgi:hypothetical protein